jgi:AraC-like DNA-binding protein
LAAIRHGGGGEKARVVCGYLGCDRMDGNPLTSALPPIVRFDARKGNAAAWMKSSLAFAADEIAGRRAGSETVLAKLSELLFVEALRRYVEGLPDEQTGWLAGLKDPFVSRALSLLHRHVVQQWTVDDLERDIGLSRSALADRFTRLIGVPPMRYLARWRLQLAAHHLRSSDIPLARIAEQVGYESGAAFNRAFKRSFRSSASHLAQERVRNKCGVTEPALRPCCRLEYNSTLQKVLGMTAWCFTEVL